MNQPGTRTDQFKEQLRESLQRYTLNTRSVKFARHANVYTCGDQDDMVYFIESGQVKLLMLSPEGKECLLDIRSAGDLFGELCLSGLGHRLETATAMKPTVLKQIPSGQLLERLSRDLLLDRFVRYLASRLTDQQEVIANMVTGDSEQRLGKALLRLALSLGKKDPRGLRIEAKISHEELSEMVGTTRPRISMFMEKFRKDGLLETDVDHAIVINEKMLGNHLARIAIGPTRRRGANSFRTYPEFRQVDFAKFPGRPFESKGR